jgi:catechol 2,3-dioxygenase
VSLGTDSAASLRRSQAGLPGRLMPKKHLVTFEAPPRARLGRVGFYVRGLHAGADFYKRVLSLVETDRGVSGGGDPIVFLTGGSTAHHSLVPTASLPAGVERTWLNQVSFRVGSLHEIQQFHDWLRRCGVAPAATVSHENAWSIYFLDPEAYTVERYASSPWYGPQPLRVPIDLSRPAHELLSETYDRCWGIRRFQSDRRVGTSAGPHAALCARPTHAHEDLP